VQTDKQTTDATLVHKRDCTKYGQLEMTN